MKGWIVALWSITALKTFAYPASTDLLAIPSDDDIQLPPLVPAKIKATDKPSDPAGKIVKLRYGPFTLPPNSIFSVLPEQVGGVKIHKPCDECYLGAFQGGLEYEDGSEANVNTGMYLHHFVLTNNNKPDWLCGLRLAGVFRPAYIYNSGNERPPVRLNSKYKFGMRVDKPDTFSTAGELMNMSNDTKTVYATIIYEVIPLDTPGYREATHLRIDAWQCGASDVPAKSGAYQYTTPKFTSPYAGVILHTDGHGHDGTVAVNLLINGKPVCNSTQYYGLRRAATQPHNIAVHHGDSPTVGMQYISDAVACEDEGRVEKGDVIWAEAFYNGTKYPQMVFKGHRENQMGIHFLYIGRDEATLKDKLLFEPRFDEWPPEMNITALQATMPALPQINMSALLPPGSSMPPSARPTPVYNSSAPLTLIGLLDMYGQPRDTNLTKLFPTIPPDFNVSNPYVVAPFAPIPPPEVDVSQYLRGLPKGNLNLFDPFTRTMIEAMIRWIPGVPKDFKLSTIITSGGLVVSEVDALVDKVFKNNGIPKPKDPFEELFEGHGRYLRQELEPVMGRSLARLEG